MILSVSSSKIGIKRSAMDIIMETSCTGTLNFLSGFNRLSRPSVRWFGVVVRVISDEPMISITRRTAILDAISMPSHVIFNFQIVTAGVPGVRKRLNTTAKSIRNTIDFIPFTMNLKGTFDNRMHSARNSAASRYPHTLFTTNREMINASVPTSFTRQSSLCSTESV